jgi:diguanylate cyclase (GGDEF)-like protein
MESVLKHLVEITGHRDHDLLSVSVLSALCELCEADSGQIYEIYKFKDQSYLRPQLRMHQGQILPPLSNAQDPDGLPLSSYPELNQGLMQFANLIEGTTDAGLNCVWVPLWNGEKASACIQVTQPRVFSKNTKEVMNGILIVYRNFQNLLDYSERDSLTGLFNRKTFEDKFSKILRACAEDVNTNTHSNKELSIPERRSQHLKTQNWLAVLDIDHFKRVNDQFGHVYGDEVLILVANLLRASFRPNDALFRFGGEEFVILLRATSLQDASMIFDRFRENVSQHFFPQVGQVTVSVGFALINPVEPAVGIIGRADQALYYAKTHGRNQTQHYESLVEQGLLTLETTEDNVEFF